MLKHWLLIVVVFPVLITSAEVSIKFKGNDEAVKYPLHTVKEFKTIQVLYDDIGFEGTIPLDHVTEVQFNFLVRLLDEQAKHFPDCSDKPIELFELLNAANYLDAPSGLKDTLGAEDAVALKKKTPTIIVEQDKYFFAGLANELEIHVAKHQLHDLLKNVQFLASDLIETKNYRFDDTVQLSRPILSNITQQSCVCMYKKEPSLLDRPAESMEYVAVDFTDKKQIIAPKKIRIVDTNIDKDWCGAISRDGRYLLTMAKDESGSSRAYLKDTTENEKNLPQAELLEDNTITPKNVLAALFNDKTNKFNIVVIKHSRREMSDLGKKLCFFEIDPTINPLSVKKIDEFGLDVKENLTKENIKWGCVSGNLVGVEQNCMPQDKRRCFLYANNQLDYCFQKTDGTLWTEKAGEDKPFDAPFSILTLDKSKPPRAIAIQKSFIPGFEQLIAKSFSSAMSATSHLRLTCVFDSVHLCINSIGLDGYQIHMLHPYPPTLMTDILSLHKQLQLGQCNNLLAQAFVLNQRWLNPDGWKAQCMHILAAKLPEVTALQSIKE